jgi:putative membrane protein
MIRLVILILLQALAVFYVFPAINEDFRVRGDFGNAVVVVLLFVILNWILRRLFVIFTLGIGFVAYYLTLGILGLVANAVVLIMIDEFFRDLLTVPSYGAAFLGGLLLAFINFLFGNEGRNVSSKKK